MAATWHTLLYYVPGMSEPFLLIAFCLLYDFVGDDDCMWFQSVFYSTANILFDYDRRVIHFDIISS